MNKKEIFTGIAVLASIFVLNITIVNAQWPNCLNGGFCHDGYDINISVWNSTTSMHKDVNKDGVSNNSDCLTCHTPPGESPYMDCCNAIFDTPTYYCADCHVNSTPPVSGAPQVGEHHNGSSDVDTAVECWDCHVNNKLSATYSGGDFRVYNLTISDAAHYGVRPTHNTSNCINCHFDTANATLWGNAKLVNNTLMGGVFINDTATSDYCYLCHGDVSATNFHDSILSGGLDPFTPTISSIQVTNLSEVSAVITWTTDEPSDSLVKFGSSPAAYTNSVYDATYVNSHTIALSSLSSGTTYYYVVNSTDPSGNSNQSDEYTFATPSSLEDRVSALEAGLAQKNEEIDNLNATVQELETKVDILDSTINALKDFVKRIYDALPAGWKNKIGDWPF